MRHKMHDSSSEDNSVSVFRFRLHIGLALNRQPHPGPSMLILCKLFNDTHVMMNKKKFLDHDRPKPVPTLALDAIHRGREVRVLNSILLF